MLGREMQRERQHHARDAASHQKALPLSWRFLNLRRFGHRDSEASRSGFLAKWLFGGLGYQGPKITNLEEANVFVGLAAEGGRPKKHSFLEHVCGFLALVSQPSKKTLGQTNTSGCLCEMLQVRQSAQDAF